MTKEEVIRYIGSLGVSPLELLERGVDPRAIIEGATEYLKTPVTDEEEKAFLLDSLQSALRARSTLAAMRLRPEMPATSHTIFKPGIVFWVRDEQIGDAKATLKSESRAGGSAKIVVETFKPSSDGNPIELIRTVVIGDSLEASHEAIVVGTRIS